MYFYTCTRLNRISIPNRIHSSSLNLLERRKILHTYLDILRIADSDACVVMFDRTKIILNIWFCIQSHEINFSLPIKTNHRCIIQRLLTQLNSNDIKFTEKRLTQLYYIQRERNSLILHANNSVKHNHSFI